MDEIEDLPIVREDPPAPIEVTEHRIQPVLSEAEYKKMRFCYATAEMGRNEIEPNVVYWDWAEYRSTLAKLRSARSSSGALRRNRGSKSSSSCSKMSSPSPAWLKAHIAVEESHMNKGSRAADGQKYGRKLTLGWLPQLPGYAAGSGYNNVRTAQTLYQPELLAALYPLIREMDQLVERAVPDYHKYAFKCAIEGDAARCS